MARTYQCQDFQLDVPDEWQQQIIHLIHARHPEDLQVVMIEAPSAHEPLVDQDRHHPVAAHVAEYAVAKALARSEWVKARARDSESRLIREERVECRGALAHRIDFEWRAQPPEVLRSRELHLVRGPLYVKVQAVIAAERYDEVASRLDALFGTLAVEPDPARAERWVDEEYDIEPPVEVPEASPKKIDPGTMPEVLHPEEGRPSAGEPGRVDPGQTPRRLEYVLQYGAASAEGAPAAEATSADDAEEPDDTRLRLDRFLRYTTGAAGSESTEEE